MTLTAATRKAKGTSNYSSSCKQTRMRVTMRLMPPLTVSFRTKLRSRRLRVWDKPQTLKKLKLYRPRKRSITLAYSREFSCKSFCLLPIKCHKKSTWSFFRSKMAISIRHLSNAKENWKNTSKICSQHSRHCSSFQRQKLIYRWSRRTLQRTFGTHWNLTLQKHFHSLSRQSKSGTVALNW